MSKRSKSNNRKKKIFSGEIELSGYFDTGFRGEGEEEVSEKRNLDWMFFVAIFLVGILFLRATYLQIIKSSYYAAKADENRIKKITLNAPRGVIFDRDHKVLASNKPQFDFVMIPGLVPKDAAERKNLFRRISQSVGIGEDELESKYKESLPDSYDLVTVKENLEREEAVRIEIASTDWKGFVVDRKAKRFYPEGEIAGNLLGYVGKVNEQEMKKNPDYKMTDITGKEGLEYQYENLLKGEKGSRQVEVDSLGKAKRMVGNILPRIGESLVLTINDDLQKEAYEKLREKVEETGSTGGAVVVMDPRDGGVLALVSFPSFDNNEFVDKISPERYQEISTDERKPLFNRAISGTYPPGSTFKPLVAAAALNEKIVTSNEVLMCPAVINIGQWHFEDWKFHGPTDLNKAIAESVNTYFYIVGGGWGEKQGLGVERIKKYSSIFGLGEKTGIDLPREEKGLVPDPEWKKEVKKENWYIGDTYHLSIGQGDLLVTPIQLTSYISALVNGGTLFQPHLLDYIQNEKGEVIEKNKPKILKEKILPLGTLELVKRSMEETVASENGSGRQLKETGEKFGVSIGGKTGTAQTNEEEKYHAWFVGFAPVENPEIVVTVLVEKGGEGYKTALPVAKAVLEKYFELRKPQSLD